MIIAILDREDTRVPDDLFVGDNLPSRHGVRGLLCLIGAFAVIVGLATASVAQTAQPSPSPFPQGNPSPTTKSSIPQRLNLQTATDLLIARNLAVMAARYNVDILRAQRIAAGLRPNPTMTFSATQLTIPRNFQHPSFFIHTDPDNAAANSQYTVEVDQLIERGGKRRLRTAQADLNTQAAEAQLKDAIRQQIFQLRSAFFTAVLARENLTVARENLEHFSHTQRISRIQVSEGYLAPVDLRRVELQLLQFDKDAVTAEQTYQQSVRDVLNLIGSGDAPSSISSTQFLTASAPAAKTNTDAELEMIQGDLAIDPALISIDELRRLALANRPDVKAAQLAYEAAQTGVSLAQSQRIRDITIGGQFSRNGSDNTVGVVMGVPLAIGPRAHAAISQAVSTRLQSEAQLRLVKTQALTDVEKAFTAYRISRDRLRLYTGSALQMAADVRRIEEASYREGAKGLLDYLDAQRTYNQTRVDYNQARFDFLMSLYQLEFAAGTPIVR